MIEVNSSNIRAIDHDGTHLMVEFKNGSKYRYKNVSSEVFESLKKAESKGRFVNSEIKGKFDYERIINEYSTCYSSR